MDALENFPEVDFSSIKLNIGVATSSLLQTSSEDINIEVDATTQPTQDIEDDPPQWKNFNLLLLLLLLFMRSIA